MAEEVGGGGEGGEGRVGGGPWGGELFARVHGHEVAGAHGGEGGAALAEGVLDGDGEGVDGLARHVGAVAGRGAGGVVSFMGAVELVLVGMLDLFAPTMSRLSTYVVVVCVPHLQAAVTAGADAVVVVAGDVAEVVAALPLAAVPPRVALHDVRRRVVVPGADEADGIDRGFGLSFWGISEWTSRRGG